MKEKEKDLSKFVMGTAQLGLAYGATNSLGLIGDEDAEDLLQTAVRLGVRNFDTARLYGQSELRLGRFFAGLPELKGKIRLYTKLAPLESNQKAVTAVEQRNHVKSSLGLSMQSLCTQSLDMVLLHRWSDWKVPAVREQLLEAKEAGHIQVLGVSLTSPFEALEVLEFDCFGAIQLSTNFLDWRWKKVGLAYALSKRPDVTVFARSVFLQGLLLNPPSRWPKLPNVDPFSIFASLEAARKTLGFGTMAELCLSFAKSQNWINFIVLGVEEPQQLVELTEAFSTRSLTSDELDYLEMNLGQVEEVLLMPQFWPQFSAS